MSERSSQFPSDSEFGRVWQQAAHDLHISVEVPFTLSTTDGDFVFPAFIRNFGSRLGTVVLTGAVQGHNTRAYAAARAQGYYVSILGDSYASYDRQLIIETL